MMTKLYFKPISFGTISFYLGLSIVSSQTVLDAGLVTRTTVDEYADIALDIREIRNYRSDSNRIEALWEDGMHFVSKNGHRGSFEKMAEELIADDSPTSVIYREGLRSAFVFERPNFVADNVRKTIQSSPDQVADTLLSSLLWMYASRLLFQGIQTCHLRSTADNPNYVQESTFGFDEFIALWMGRDSSAVDSLYGWTQQVSELFGLNQPESKTNTEIKLLYQQGAAALALPNACTKQNPDTVPQLWMVAVQITNEMIKPLIQSLLHSLEQSDLVTANVYATALIPHLYKCRPSLFKHFADVLVTGDLFQLDADTVKQGLKEAALQCFGIPCLELSKNGYGITCYDGDDPSSLQIGGYRTSSKTAAKLSRIDLDIRLLKILFKRSSNARLVYQYGWHVDLPKKSEFDPFELESLHTLALKAARSETATAYLAYYDIINYAEKLVVYPVFEGTSKWVTEEQQREALVLSSSFQIVFLEALRRLDEVVASCEENIADGYHSEPVDDVAALLIGSLEGSSLGGSPDVQDGLLAWNLGSRHAFRFQTMSSYNYGNVNQDLIDELYAAKAEIDSGVCTRLLSSVQNIRGLMQASMMQAIMAASLEIERDHDDESSTFLVQADILATALLPLIHGHDPETAEFLRENLLHRPGVKMVSQGASEVSKAITDYVQFKLLLPPCHYLGGASSLDCHQFQQVGPRRASAVDAPKVMTSIFLGIVVSIWQS